MIKNLEEYFLPEQTYFLNSVNYKILDNASQDGEIKCIDNINTNVTDDGVRVIFTRTLKFTPESIFELSVSFGTILKFNEKNKDEIKWNDISLAKEFKDNGAFVLQNLLNRTSLLIAEITASFGQIPIIIPPIIGSEELS